MKSANIGKVAFESGLIVFSVLLALFLNEVREQFKQQETKDHALQMIKVELQNNLTTLNQWLPYHKDVLQNFEQSLKLDKQGLVLDNQYAYISQQMPEGVIRAVLDDSSWEAIKQSAVSSTLDVDTLFALSKTYKIQHQGVESTLKRILAILYSREAVSEGELQQTLLLLRNAFQELIAQEIYLIQVYQDVIKDL